MSILSAFVATITAPYRMIRSGIFHLIYPAWYLHKPTADEINRKQEEPEIEYISRTIMKINLRNAVSNDTKNPFQIDIDCCMLFKEKTEVYDVKKQYIIHCDGNATCYEHNLDMMRIWCNENRNIVAFNPPGVKFSPGSSKGPEDYMRALKCMIEHLHAQGIPYENITLSGFSIGAAISTMVAIDYHKQNHRIKLFDDRSFSSMAAASAAFVKKSIPTVILRETLGNLLYLTVNGFVRLFGLNFSPAQAFTEINTLHPGDARCIVVKDDNIVPYAQSLYAALSSEMQNKYADIFETEIALNGDEPHHSPLETLISQNSGLTAEEYVLSSFNIFYSNTQTFKQKTELANKLLGQSIVVIHILDKIQKDGISKISQSKLQEIQKTLHACNTRIDAHQNQLLEHNKLLVQSEDPKLQQLRQLINELIGVAEQVQVLLRNTQLRISNLQQPPKKSILFRVKAAMGIAPEEATLDIDFSQIKRQLDQFASKFSSGV